MLQKQWIHTHNIRVRFLVQNKKIQWNILYIAPPPILTAIRTLTVNTV